MDKHTPLQLDEAGLTAARGHLDDGAVTPAYGPWRDDIVSLLNGALATELTCVLRYRRHHFMAAGLESPTIAGEFLVHANAELAHADRLAQRIVQLGGEPGFNPVGLLERSHADYDAVNDLKGMIRANLVLMPIDMFVNTIFKRTGWKWGNIKTGFDCTLLVTSALIGLAFLGEIKFIREGTILNAILVGQYIKLYFFLYRKISAKNGGQASGKLEAAAE